MNLTGRENQGSKYHASLDRRGEPFNVRASGASRRDSMLAIKVGGRGYLQRWSLKLYEDNGYDNRRVSTYLRRRSTTARIPRIGGQSSQRLSYHR